MEEILKFENREKLFKFLVEEFNLKKIEEHYDPEVFGNFFIILSAKDFILRYINDKGFLTVEIASIMDKEKWYDLSYIKDFIYNKGKVNADDRILSNNDRIEELNNFLRREYNIISLLFSQQNYPDIKDQLTKILKQQFDKKFK